MRQDTSTMMGSTAGYAAVFVAGLAIGTLATGGLLLYMAPASSRKMQVTKKAKGLRDQAYDRVDDLKGNANGWLSRGRSESSKMARQARGMRKDAMDRIQDLGRGQRGSKHQSKTARGFVGAGRRIVDRMLG